MADRKWVLVKQISGAGGITLANPDGTVRGLNPSSLSEPYGPYHWAGAPPGTDGSYERCVPGGGSVAYNPTGKEVIVFGFKETVPNAPGFSAMTEEPL